MVSVMHAHLTNCVPLESVFLHSSGHSHKPSSGQRRYHGGPRRAQRARSAAYHQKPIVLGAAVMVQLKKIVWWLLDQMYTLQVLSRVRADPGTVATRRVASRMSCHPFRGGGSTVANSRSVLPATVIPRCSSVLLPTHQRRFFFFFQPKLSVDVRALCVVLCVVCCLCVACVLIVFCL